MSSREIRNPAFGQIRRKWLKTQAPQGQVIVVTPPKWTPFRPCLIHENPYRISDHMTSRSGNTRNGDPPPPPGTHVSTHAHSQQHHKTSAAKASVDIIGKQSERLPKRPSRSLRTGTLALFSQSLRSKLTTLRTDVAHGRPKPLPVGRRPAPENGPQRHHWTLKTTGAWLGVPGRT